MWERGAFKAWFRHFALLSDVMSSLFSRDWDVQERRGTRARLFGSHGITMRGGRMYRETRWRATERVGAAKLNQQRASEVGEIGRKEGQGEVKR